MTGRARTEARPHGDRRRWIALGVVCLAMFMNTLDGSVVNVALPAIQTDLAHRAGQPDLDRQRLPDHVRQLPAAGRPAGRPDRPQTRVPERRHALHARLAAVRARAGREAPDRGALRPGARRRRLLVGDHRHDRLRVPRAGRAREGHERVHLRGRGRRLDRAARRRARHAGRSDWHWIFFINIPIGAITLLLGRALLEESDAHRPRQGRRRARVGHGHRRADARHLRDRDDARSRLGLRAHAALRAAPRSPCWRAFFALRRASRTRSCRCASCASPGLASTSIVRGLLAIGLFSTFFLGRALPRARARATARCAPASRSCRSR